MPVLQRSAGPSAEEILGVIEIFLKQCKERALLEPGEELLPVTAENPALDVRGSRLTLQASVPGRPLHVVDDQQVGGTSGWLEFQPELG
jgi:hypothetical protein